MLVQPAAEQLERIALLAQFFRSRANELFPTEAYTRRYGYDVPTPLRLKEERFAGHYSKAIKALRETYSDAVLTKGFADLLAFPSHLHLEASPDAPYTPEAWQPLHAAWSTAGLWTMGTPSEYAVALMKQRIRLMLTHIFQGTECPPAKFTGYVILRELWQRPQLPDCIEILVASAELPSARAVLRSLVTFAFDAQIEIPEDVRRSGYGHVWESDSGSRSSYALLASDLGGPFASALNALATYGELSFEAFCEVVRRMPGAFPGALVGKDEGWFEAQTSPLLVAHVRRLSWECGERLNTDDQQFLKAVYWSSGLGSRWLVKCCEHVTRLGLSSLSTNEYSGVVPLLRRMAGICGIESDEREVDVVSRLSSFPAKTLLAVLPAAAAGESLILRALGYGNATALLDLARSIKARRSAGEASYGDDIPNCADPTAGVVDRQAILRSVEAAGEEASKKVMAAFRRSREGLDNTLFLFEAAAGWNRDTVNRRLSKHGQIALKACGLLPLERGHEEAMERYLLLKKAAREANQYGPERTQNTKAAVEVGLTNLAHNLGYADSTRLEWAMEAKVSTDVAPVGRAHPIGVWEVTLEMPSAGPQIVVRKGARRLAAVPAGIKKRPEFLGVKAAHGQLKEQFARFRRTLESLMATAETLNVGELANLTSLPAASALLTRLILRTADGRLGLMTADGNALSGLGDEVIALQGPVSIAHPHDLFVAGALADWQREIVRRRVTQPFKQAFRELYIVTPAEEATCTFSNRFAGHVVDPRVASRLLASRGWEVVGGEYEPPVRRFHRLGISAYFSFPDMGHFLAETDILTTDQVTFARQGTADPQMRLTDVPPTIFSEVMRDADLVVSVAAVTVDANVWSRESYEHRAEVVSALVDQIGLPGVICDGHFARVVGKRATYRVHLGAATVHIEPGNYLCIVPVPGRRPDLYLPFVDDDAKTAEILSKLLLLSNDDQITDALILQQIRASQSTSLP